MDWIQELEQLINKWDNNPAYKEYFKTEIIEQNIEEFLNNIKQNRGVKHGNNIL